MSARPSVTSPLAGPTKFDRKSLILSMRIYERAVTCIAKPTDLFLLRNSHLCLSPGGTSRVSVDKTRRCDVTKSVTGRVRFNCLPPKITPTCAMSHPRLEPVVLISSLPPGSPSRKRRLREDIPDGSIRSPHKRLSESQQVAQRGKGMYVYESQFPGHGLLARV